MKNCPFCDRTNITSDIVYEDDLVLAFYDIDPINEGHVLIIPKEHYLDADEMPDELLARLAAVSKKTVAALKKTYRPDGYTVMQNGGKFNDIGHDHCTGGDDGKFILEHKDRLAHMHIHDAVNSNGTRRDHLTLGEGELDIKKYLSLAEDRGCTVVLETKTSYALRRSVDYIRG